MSVRSRLAPSAMPIKMRLTLWYTAILAVMLGAFSLAVYWYMGTSLTADMDRSSRERADRVSDVIRAGEIALPGPGGAPVPFVEIDRFIDPFRDPGVSVRIFDSRGGFVAGSRELVIQRDRIPINRTATIAAIGWGVEHREVLNTRQGSFYAFTSPALTNNGQVIGAVQILTSRGAYKATMDRLASLLFVGTLLAIGLSLAIGLVMAQTALAPIDAITRTAQQINRSKDLGRRVMVRGPRDEVGRLSETMNDMLDNIEGMFERQRQFLADASHELRTPLTTIRGELELMERTKTLDPEVIEAMREESERMSRLVSDLLLLARADSGLQVEQMPVRLDSLLPDLYRQGRTLAGESHTIRYKPSPPVTVVGDKDRLKQLVLILIDNAIKHTPAGSTVTLSASTDHSGPLRVARIVVEDDGPGIPVEDQTRIFDRLYRVDKARSRLSGGSGLGLSIARWIASAHHGTLSVTNRTDGGARFVLELPIDGPKSTGLAVEGNPSAAADNVSTEQLPAPQVHRLAPDSPP